MAHGGGDKHPDKEKAWHPLSKNGNPSLNRSLSRNDVGNQARFLLTRFIHDRMDANGIQNTPTAAMLVTPGTPLGPPVEHIKDVSNALKKIGDELDEDAKLQSMINQISPDAPRKTFLYVAKEIFADGVFNWGRVVALFYFGYKMTIRTLEAFTNQIPLVQPIIELIIEFIVDYVSPWILDRGGWGAILEYFGTPSLQLVAIFVSGIVCSTLVYYSKS